MEGCHSELVLAKFLENSALVLYGKYSRAIYNHNFMAQLKYMFPHRYTKTNQKTKLQGQVESKAMQKEEKERTLQKETSGEEV